MGEPGEHLGQMAGNHGHQMGFLVDHVDLPVQPHRVVGAEPGAPRRTAAPGDPRDWTFRPSSRSKARSELAEGDIGNSLPPDRKDGDAFGTTRGAKSVPIFRRARSTTHDAYGLSPRTVNDVGCGLRECPVPESSGRYRHQGNLRGPQPADRVGVSPQSGRSHPAFATAAIWAEPSAVSTIV